MVFFCLKQLMELIEIIWYLCSNKDTFSSDMKICGIGSLRLRMPTASRKIKKKKKELNNHLRGNMIKEKRNVIRNDLSLWLFVNILWSLSVTTSSLGIIHFEVN